MSFSFDNTIEKLLQSPRDASLYLSPLPDEDMPNFFGVCSAKNLPLEIWNSIAIGLYDLKRTKQFLELMNFLINVQMEKPFYNDESNESKKISLVNTLSIYYLALAANENDPKQKSEYFALVRINFNKSDKIKLEESSSFALKGYLLFFEGEYQQALAYFNQNSSCVVSLLGTAILEFSSKNYEESLKLFKTALKLNPKLPPNARLGLAYNFFFLEKYHLAYATFQRILKMDPNNVDAILGLAVLEFRNSSSEKYLEYLEKCFNIEKTSPFLLLHLAEYFLLRGDIEKAKITAVKGYKNLKNFPKFVIDTNSQLNERKKRRNDFYEAKSKLLYIVGYYYHLQSNYSQALKYYEESVQAFPLNLSAQYSLGQVCIFQKNFVKAMKCFEIVSENSKENNEECWKILGYLYIKNGKRAEGIDFYQRSLRFDPLDFDTWIEYASLQEHYDIKVSLEAYEKALEVLNYRIESAISPTSEEVKPELLNNIGVLKMKLEKYEEALSSFQKALEICQNSDEPRMENGRSKYLIYTILFNMGVLYEETKKLKEANEHYKKILFLNPFYIDAYLRLAFLALKRGSAVKALDYCKQAVEKIEYSKKIRPDLTMCLKGFIFQEIGDITNARQSYENIKKKYGLEDVFADFAIMKIYYDESCELREQIPEQKKYLKSIIEQSKIILNHEESNYQAALMIAIVMAELGHFREAKEIFNQIESNQQNFGVLVNVAHLEYLKGNYENAIKIYTSYLQKLQVHDEYIEMCIVLNHYLLKNHDEALKAMKKLILKNPESLVHRYNLCVLLHNSSQSILEQKDRRKDQTEKAIEYLKKIQTIYEYLFKNNYARKTREEFEKSDDARRKIKRLMDRIREASENNLNFIQSHQSRFESFLKEDEEIIKKKHLSVEEKKRKIQEMKERELQERLEKERIAEEKRQAYERLAVEQMQNAQKIAEELRERHETNLQMKKMRAQNRNTTGKTRKTKKQQSDEEEENRGESEQEISDDQGKDEPSMLSDVKDEGEDHLDQKDELDLMEEKIEAEEQIRKKKKSLKKKFKDEETFLEKNEEKKDPSIKKKKKFVKHFDQDDEEEFVYQENESPQAKEYDPFNAGDNDSDQGENTL